MLKCPDVFLQFKRDYYPGLSRNKILNENFKIYIFTLFLLFCQTFLQLLDDKQE